MSIVAENHSMYPRVGESDHHLRLRRAYHQYDRDEITEAELKTIEDNYVEEVIKEQFEHGLDVATDGMIRWYDHVSHLARGIDGAEVGGLVRFFDTNYLVREARITDHIEWREALTVNEFEFADSVSSGPVKAVLTGPLTMARHSIIDDSPYTNERALAEDYARVLKQEFRSLVEAGMTEFQIEEPSLLQTPDQAEWLLPLIDDIYSGHDSVHTRIATYFGDAVPLYDELQDTGADTLIVDFTYSDRLTEVIQSDGSDKRLGFGLLNGRNTKLSDVDETAGRVSEMLESVQEDDHILTFSCSLDYLPRDRTLMKLDRLVEIKDAIRTKEGGVVRS